MTAKLPTRPTSRAHPAEDRGAAPVTRDKRGSLRWVRDVLGRSIRLEQRRDPLATAAADGKRGGTADAPLSLLMKQRAELGARLLVHDPATQPVRNLFVVHDELGRRGWSGVEALSPQIIDRALTEAEIMASDEPSTLLGSIIDGLQSLKHGFRARAAHEAHAASEREWETLKVPEVSETNYDEYELMERSWVGTVPAGL